MIVVYPQSNHRSIANKGQGDREGRPYNTRRRVTRAIWYCRGDPRGRPGSPIVFLAIIHKLCFRRLRERKYAENLL